MAKVSTNFQFQNGHLVKSNKLAMNMKTRLVTFIDAESKQRDLYEHRTSKDGSKTFKLKVIIMDYCGKSFFRLPILEHMVTQWNLRNLYEYENY